MLQKKIRVAAIVKEIELFEDNLIFIDEMSVYAKDNEDFEELLKSTKEKVKLKIIDLNNETNGLIKELKINGIK